MAEVMAGLGVGVALVLLAPRLWDRRPRRSRRVECARCGDLLAVRRAVVVASVDEDADGTGSGMVAEFHRRCARREGVA